LDAKIQKQIDDALNVGDLKKFLEDLPDNMPIGVAGHYGELLLADKYDIRQSQAYLTPSGIWHKGERVTIKFVQIEMPELGEEPD
jgi:hypothetical protein